MDSGAITLASVPCAGCGGNVYPPWSWLIEGKEYCGDCAEKTFAPASPPQRDQRAGGGD